jgi:hypothetical protein
MTQLRALALIAITSVTAAHAGPYCRLTGDKLVLGNAAIQREWARRGTVWSTVAFARGDGSDALPVFAAEEFTVKVYQGATVPASAFTWSAPKTTASSVTFEATSPTSGLKVAVRYWVHGDDPFMRKQLTVTGRAETVIDELDVERLTVAAPATRGGYGQPAFLGDIWYAGLEYPAGYNDLRLKPGETQRDLILHHYPGRSLAAPLVSKPAVIGVTPRGLTRELAFSDYLNTIRIQTRNFLQYNSWYDLQGDAMTIPNVLDAFHKFKVNLLDPYRLKMDAFTPDDGWQDYNSIWKPNPKRYPQGFRPLAQGLEKGGSRLGLWMPLNGTNLNIDWGVAQGYERSNLGDFYCIAAPKYNAEIRRATERLIRDGNLAYYKHDFNSLQCSAPGHGHLPDQLHGHEASLDAEIDLLAFERKVNPSIFLNITSSVWLSPWWLMYADSIWMCAGDFGYEKTFPQLAPREWDMSYRDGHFYNVYMRDHNLVPLSALMTHGIIHGRLCKLGGDDETLREFSDMAVLYYARGVQLKELYITPDLMDKPRWEVLGEATRWAVENSEALRNTVMIGGDVRQGEPYGYVHWNGDHGIIALRNPAPGAASIRVPFDQSVFYRGATRKAFSARVIYPYYASAPRTWVSGREARWDIPGCSVMLIDVTPGRVAGAARVPSGAEASPPPITTSLDAQSLEPLIRTAFAVPNEDMARCDLYLTVRAQGQTDFTSISIDGRAAKLRRADGPNWHLQSIDLRALRGKSVTVEAKLPPAGERPFSSTRATVEAWLVMDRPVVARDARPSGLHTPLPIAQQYARQTVCALKPTLIERKRELIHITDDELAHLKAARLRLEVFDVNGEPQYIDKWITLNGEKLARVPPNRGELSAWQETFIDIPPEQVSRLRRTNVIQLGNAGGDCYKFRGVALALQRLDGTWSETAVDPGTYTSCDPGWLYYEGTQFTNDQSPEITVEVP